MMDWERPLMERHAALICGPGPAGGGDVLNVGFGLGIIDSAIQQHKVRGGGGAARPPARPLASLLRSLTNRAAL